MARINFLAINLIYRKQLKYNLKDLEVRTKLHIGKRFKQRN